MATLDALQWHGYFVRQKERFVEGLKARGLLVRWKLNWQTISPEKPGNWFVMFAPPAWVVGRGDFSGVHYTLKWYRPRQTAAQPGLRLSVGVESPLRDAYKTDFKRDVVAAVLREQLALPDCRLWPEAGVQRGAKLLETRVPATKDAARILLERYAALERFNAIVAEAIRDYATRGAFG